MTSKIKSKAKKNPSHASQVVKVIERDVSGVIKWYNKFKRYGFIKRKDDGKEIFLHGSEVKNIPSKFKAGEELIFDVAETAKSPIATNVRCPHRSSQEHSSKSTENKFPLLSQDAKPKIPDSYQSSASVASSVPDLN